MKRRRPIMLIGGLCALSAFAPAAGPRPAEAGEADVTAVEAQRAAAGWIFTVTVAHADTGWEHYADGIDVVLPDGTVAATRVLLHPHVNEQPFTRATQAVDVPAGTPFVVIRAHDSVDGLGGAEITYQLEPGPGQ